MCRRRVGRRLSPLRPPNARLRFGRWKSYFWLGSAKTAATCPGGGRAIRTRSSSREVMLQQTQVERVIPRWLAWLERWPTPAALAAASPADVIREWQGLGYNRRAISLHRAAQVVAATGWPDDLTALPGVGPYTAAAIRNQAYGEPVLPIDTNVARIQERTGHAFGPGRCRRSSTSAQPCASRACRAATRARWRRAAPRAGGDTSRCGSSRASRGLSGSGGPRSCGWSPPRRSRSTSSTAKPSTRSCATGSSSSPASSLRLPS